ncbi:hypothetical protein SDC9_113876 [bioreactor metagenome]|uniref:Uncharacterized protein n=1 Tax=bioreactor metagenome TaxID=1076179 RepID=A0A645BP51_9ZZZZ
MTVEEGVAVGLGGKHLVGGHGAGRAIGVDYDEVRAGHLLGILSKHTGRKVGVAARTGGNHDRNGGGGLPAGGFRRGRGGCSSSGGRRCGTAAASAGGQAENHAGCKNGC